MKKFFRFTGAAILVAGAAFMVAYALKPRVTVSPQLAEQYGKLPVVFEANAGQTDAQVKFIARGQRYALFLTPREAVFALAKDGERSALRMHFGGANPEPILSGLDELPAKVNYFIGQDPSAWRTNVTTYRAVRYAQIYPGVDLVYHGNQRQLEFDFKIAPGADPKKIAMAFSDPEKLEVEPDSGDLLIHAAGGVLRQHAPVAYQAIDSKQVRIASRYAMRRDGSVGFELGHYDMSKELVIDPTLSYASYLGGNGTGNGDLASALAVDASGNAYIAGSTTSFDFPVTSGAYQTTHPDDGSINGSIAFVTKVNSTGTALIYSTYLGPSSACNVGGTGCGTGASAIAVDGNGNAYVSGATNSSSFPTTPGAYQPNYRGTDQQILNAFVLKLNSTGSGLIYSTYLGGTGSGYCSANCVVAGDGVAKLAIDSSGNVYLGGSTYSRDFPTTPGAYQTVNKVQNSDNPFRYTGFITKLNSTGTALVYSTYLGGSERAGVAGLALGPGDEVYVTGQVALTDTDFPTTPGAFQTTRNGFPLAFVSKLSADGSTLVYSTLLGGSYGGNDGRDIAVNASGNAFVTGTTAATSFPTTPGAFRTTFCGGTLGDTDVFVTKLNADGTGLVYSTLVCTDVYSGTGSDEQSSRIALDAAGNAYISGFTGTLDYPTTPDGYQQTLAGHYDAFFTKLNSTGTALLYSTMLGGASGFDYAQAIALDPANNAYLLGTSESTDFPITPGVFQPSLHAERDIYIAKFDMTQAGPVAPPCAAPPPGIFAWYPAEGTVDDVSGGNHHASLQGGATFTSAKVGQGFLLDGVDDYVSVANNNAPNFSGSFSVEGWVRIDAYSSIFNPNIGVNEPAYTPIAARWNDIGTNHRSFFLGISPQTQLQFGVSQDGSAAATVTQNHGSIALRGYHHVAGVFDSAAKTVTLYIDGTQVGQVAALGSTVFSSTEPLLIGAGDLGGKARTFTKGVIDELTLYNSALSPAEVNGLFRAWTSGKCTAASPTTPTPGPTPTPTPRGCQALLDDNFAPKLSRGSSQDAAFSVYDTRVQTDDKILAAGDFTQVNGIPRNSIARFNSGGSLDTSFNAGAIDGYINHLALQPDGKLIIGGLFFSVQGSARSGLARLGTDGTLDSTFSSTAFGGRNGLAVGADSKLVAIDNRLTNSSGTGTPNAFIVRRFNTDGTRDTSFTRLDSPETDGDVTAVVIQPDGKIVLGGNFTQIRNTSRRNIARLNTDGSLDTTFNPGTGFSFPGLTSDVFTMVLDSNGKILVGGLFNSYNGVSRRGIARLNTDGSLDTGFTAYTESGATVDGIAVQADGKVVIGGLFTRLNGAVVRFLARLNGDGAIDADFDTLAGPDQQVERIAVQAQGQIIISGVFFTYNNISRVHIARLVGTTCGSGVPTPTPTPTPSASPTPNPAPLRNLSTRAHVTGGSEIAIGGFIINGSAPRRVVMRGVGPSLPGYVPNRLADPVLNLFGSSSSTTIATNDNWKSSQQSQIEATGLTPGSDLDAAIMVDLPPGNYTAQLSGNGGATGIGLIEIYDLGEVAAAGTALAGATSEVANISTRGMVQTDDDILIGGLIVGPGAATSVVVDARGSSLPQEISARLSDPNLTLHDENGNVIAANDNWQEDVAHASIPANLSSTYNESDSALYRALVPGAYTVVVRGKDNSSGVALVEVFHIPPN